MAEAFVRQLGAQSGVQLNPLRDASEVPASGIDDQVFGVIMRCTRGRIDQPFLVDRSNVSAHVGIGESIRKNKLNTAYVHVVEALRKGAYQAVVQRLVNTENAKIKLAVATVSGNDISYSIADNAPDSGAFITVKHLECYNDGIRVSIHAPAVRSSGANIATKVIRLTVSDSKGIELYTFSGSLDPDAKDDYGQSQYLPDIVSTQTDNVEVFISAEFATVSAEASYYGTASTGVEKSANSGTLICFEEGATTYRDEDLQRCVDAMQATKHDYAYLTSAGSEDMALIPKLVLLAGETNKQLRIDVPGNLTPEAAIRWVEQMNLGASRYAHLMHTFWSPLRSDDPTGVNGAGHYGVATLNIAMACLRNAQKNAFGFAPKNYPIAGRDWPIQRTRMSQTYNPTQQELHALAKAKINPCLFEQYTGGGRYVFFDSLTSALVDSSLIKLISVADMSTSIDRATTRRAKDLLQLPMAVAVERMQIFLQTHFEQATASGWLVESEFMDGASFQYDVRPNAQRPYDQMDVQYWLRYDGVARQIHVTQTITR